MNNVIRIDKDWALELLRQVVEGHEDFVYVEPADSRCLYFHDEVPGCVVGHVLALAGANPKQLKQLDDDCDDSTIDAVEVPWLELVGGAAEVLAAAQGTQDRGDSWGEAFEAAARVVTT